MAEKAPRARGLLMLEGFAVVVVVVAAEEEREERCRERRRAWVSEAEREDFKGVSALSSTMEEERDREALGPFRIDNRRLLGERQAVTVQTPSEDATWPAARSSPTQPQLRPSTQSHAFTTITQ